MVILSCFGVLDAFTSSASSMRSTLARAYLAWIVVCVVWGTTYLGIRIALETIPPFLMASFRWLAAGTALVVALLIRGERLPGPRAWMSLALTGVLLMGIGNGGVVWAEQTVPSGLTAVLVAAIPFWMVGIERVMHGGERLTARRLGGLVLGFLRDRAAGLARAPARSGPLASSRGWWRRKSPASVGRWVRAWPDAARRKRTCWPRRRCRWYLPAWR